MSNNANIDKIAPDEEPVVCLSKLISFHVERELRLVLHIDDKPISPIPYEQPVNTETPASHNEAPENNCNEIPPAQITQKVCGDTDELDTESDVDIPSPDITAPGCSPPEMPNAAHSAHVPGLPPFTYVRLKGERRATCDAFRNFLQDFLYDTPNTPEREKRRRFRPVANDTDHPKPGSYKLVKITPRKDIENAHVKTSITCFVWSKK
eukprot:GEMP01097253.1.p1 GENE.GEMP01097253.1~~GEMP01097253.1.p1  ORF type:complete len:208 (+),score=34.64 GEMP01097253.1:34-657(+)